MKYFKVPSLFLALFTISFNIVLGVVTFAPHIIPYDCLSFFGSFLHFLAGYPTALKIGVAAAVVAHLAEALHVWSICRELSIAQSDTVKWVIQTLLVGFPSTLLIRAKRRSLKQQ